MDSISVQITGLDELERKLHEIGPKLARRAMKKALRAGGKVMASEVVARAPMRTDDAPGGNGLPPGAIKRDIKVQVKTNSREDAGAAVVGPTRKTAYVARWKEFGYRVTTKKPGHKIVSHKPGIAFMRQSFDATREQAIAAFTEEIRKAVEEIK